MHSDSHIINSIFKSFWYNWEDPIYTKELLRRRKSKKARRRLVNSIVKKASVNGSFERAIRFHHLCTSLANPIKQVIGYEGIARQIFRVTNLKENAR